MDRTAKPVSDEEYMAWLVKELKKDPEFVAMLARDTLSNCITTKDQLTPVGRARAALLVRRLEEAGHNVEVEKVLLAHVQEHVWPKA